MSNRTPAQVFPPGDFIREELEERGWSQADLARVIGRDESNLSKLIAGKMSLTPAMARDLSAAFGTSAEYWMNLETSYRLGQANGDDNPDVVRRRARLYDLAPVRDMQKRQWIRETNDAAELESELRKFFDNARDLETEPCLPVAARDSIKAVELTPAQRAWCFRALRLAKAQRVTPFREERLTECENRLRALAVFPEEARHVPKVLADYGIRFVIVEPLPGSRIDGATFWIDGSPVIALSARFDRIDCFWFTLLHEFSHVKHRDRQSIDTDLVGEQNDPSKPSLMKEEMEQRADREAAAMLIPPDKIQSFIVRVRPMYSKNRIIQFANLIRVHPGIIVGQLQHRGEIGFHANREMLVKVREIVASSAITDGWGRIISLEE